MTQQAVAAAFDELDEWISSNGWAGYDPYDIRGQAWFVRLFGSWCPDKLRTALYLVERSLPQQGLRKFLRIKKEINAKGMGLLASAYLARYESTGQARFLENAEQILSWLRSNADRDYPGVSWGYPFHWQSRIFIPRGTPSVVVTGTVGDAVLRHFELTGSPSSRELLQGIAEFFLRGLNRPVDEQDQLCFSYTPLDEFKVLNASLFAAGFLARLGAMTANSEYRDMALRAVRYVLAEQNDDGSFYYWGSEPPTAIDHFHTGFVLRLLDTVYRSLQADFILDPLARGYAFYRNRLFTEDGLPKHVPDSLFPINIHSCAEAIICTSQLGSRFGGFDGVVPVFRFARDEMRVPEGWYVAERRKTWHGEVSMKVPFMRWSQAWMLLAFAKLAEAMRGAPLARPEDACASG